MVSALLKFITFPVAMVYFRIRFGGDFFRKPTVCWDCQQEPVNSVCPECGGVIRSSSWGHYMGGADMGMREYAASESEVYAKRKQVKEMNQMFNGQMSVNKAPPEGPVDLTSGLLDD